MAKCLVCVDVYTVKAGDTLYTIAQNYGISVALLMRANKICNPYNLRIGTKICIPGYIDQFPTPELPQKPGTTPEKPGTTPSNPTLPACKGVLHTVVAGDTLYMIAKKYRVNLTAIIEANPGIDPYNLRVGMKICIPR